MQSNNELPENNIENHEIALRTQGSHLPSTDVRTVMPEWEDEIHLRDYLDVLLRRRWAVIVTLLIVFTTTVLYTFSRTPLYQATGLLKVSMQGIKVANFEESESSALKTLEFLQTQVELLRDDALARNVIDTLQLADDPGFNPNAANGQGGRGGLFAIIGNTLATVKDFIRPAGAGKGTTEIEQLLASEELLNRFQTNLAIRPKRNTELIEIAYDSPNAKLSAKVVNSLMDEFLTMNVQRKVDSFKSAEMFLKERIEAARIKLEKAEKQLLEFGRNTGVVSLDSRLNMTTRQLEEINEALAKAIVVRIEKETRYKQALENNGRNLQEVLNNELIQNLKEEHAKLKSEYEHLGTIFKPDYPKMKQLKAQMDDLERQANQEIDRIISAIENDYRTATANEIRLKEKAASQKERAMRLNTIATQYKILSREVDSNKSVYDSLLQRSKEIDAAIGADFGRLQIVSEAQPPALPYKPNIMRNLLLGIVLGLFAGTGFAFLREYMDNTLKTPDELSQRYQIPILGLIPHDKEKDEDDRDMAYKFYNQPRSSLAEAIRTTSVSLELSAAGHPPRSILITSVLPDAGKSTLSSNLAIATLATGGSRILLIDVDLRKPTLHKIFSDGDNSIGLSSYLTGVAEINKIVQKTEIENLYFIPSGPLTPNPAELIASGHMKKFLSLATKRFDRVILDGPPFQGFAEILLLGNIVDGVVLVTELGKTPREGIKHFRKSLVNVGGTILGAMINKASKGQGYGYYSYKYYNYDYSYGQEEEKA